MARQDLFVTLGDNLVPGKCNTSSRKGTIEFAKVEINTDLEGRNKPMSKGVCVIKIDKDGRKVDIECTVPPTWTVNKNEKSEG